MKSQEKIDALYERLDDWIDQSRQAIKDAAEVIDQKITDIQEAVNLQDQPMLSQGGWSLVDFFEEIDEDGTWNPK